MELPPGFTARTIDPEADTPAIAALCNAAAIAEYGTPELTEQIVLESYRSPGFNAQTDGLLVIDARGAAAAVVEFYDNDISHVSPFVYLRVRPDLLEAGIGEALLGWAEERGQGVLSLAAPDVRVSQHGNANGVNRPMQEIFERRGWALERTFWEMEIELGEEAPMAPVLPEGIAIRTTVAGRDEPAIKAANDEAFADHFGFVPRGYDDWLALATKMNPYDPSLWFLAVEGDEIAGIALCLLEAGGRPALGWVSTLGVRRRWRGKGLGLALLQHAFAELHRRGQRSVGLGVDSESITGATRLYERAGMHVTRETRSFAHVVRDGREIRPV